MTRSSDWLSVQQQIVRYGQVWGLSRESGVRLRSRQNQDPRGCRSLALR